MFVPVKTKDSEVLMPMHAARARKLVQRGEATPYWDNGIYCICLNKEPSKRDTQEIAVGVDPGSKKEGFTVKSTSHTYLNVQADAHSKVGKKVEKRRDLRRTRRSRSCPNRKNRTNRLANRHEYLLARVQGGIGNYVSWIGCPSCPLSRMYVLRTLRHGHSNVRKSGIVLSVLLKSESLGSIEDKSDGHCSHFKVGRRKNCEIDLGSRSLPRNLLRRLMHTV